eukprot:COSAG02_NODE_1482_length_12387_cov_6.381348_6_plen_66_part_00
MACVETRIGEEQGSYPPGFEGEEGRGKIEKGCKQELSVCLPVGETPQILWVLGVLWHRVLCAMCV